ncbi:MAG TPA: Rieske 2Fe-2S domain-containing protein [Ramlibacter sp.]|nr:Rieske 2Fe-2S domain-containing protein [Ramlibacter sp.]
MAMTLEDNDLLTLTSPGTPMGGLMRQYWIPAVRAAALVAGEAPVKVRLLGENFVAFRSPGGEVGLIEEACAHRGASMALARNEEGGLRCIFHGWKFDVTGRVIDAPAEPADRRERFCNSLPVRRYQAREAGGILWVYLGQGEAPPFPDFEFLHLGPDQVRPWRSVQPYNWLQGLEAHLDSSHVSFLHSGSLSPHTGQTEKHLRESVLRMTVDKAPKFEMEERPYGLREGALRNMGDGTTYARIRELVMPFHTFVPGPPDRQCSMRMTVPIDDETCADWYVLYDPARPLTEETISAFYFSAAPDPDNFAANLGSSENNWGQDREAMKNGHFSGLLRSISFEDFVVQASMGPRYDRSKELLGSADAVIVKARSMLLKAARDYAADRSVRWARGFDYRAVRARSVTFPHTENWRDYAWPDPVDRCEPPAERAAAS